MTKDGMSNNLPHPAYKAIDDVRQELPEIAKVFDGLIAADNALRDRIGRLESVPPANDHAVLKLSGILLIISILFPPWERIVGATIGGDWLGFSFILSHPSTGQYVTIAVRILVAEWVLIGALTIIGLRLGNAAPVPRWLRRWLS